VCAGTRTFRAGPFIQERIVIQERIAAAPRGSRMAGRGPVHSTADRGGAADDGAADDGAADDGAASERAATAR
jgi:hypothetical protein